MTNFFLWVAAGATHLTLSVWVSPAVATIISSLTLATMAAKHTDDVLRTSGYQCKTFRMYYDKFEHLQQVAHTSKYNLAAFDEEALKLSKELECYLTSITFVSPDQDDYETTCEVNKKQFLQRDIERTNAICEAIAYTLPNHHTDDHRLKTLPPSMDQTLPQATL